ncbi:glycosyltransferase family 4 protein [Gigaspora margarita]|uniref:GDP-Man:Man(3)GlcNAc(2)-PP-Dol alpha-1,2-mannosyltransferase n=1 Tax=Gigaspora margarita TaxID=4874 RepID=A0A8H4AUS0_GIGMA|nr:glycosyltransferase family 4 protein [Gigaspora margarita]
MFTLFTQSNLILLILGLILFVIYGSIKRKASFYAVKNRKEFLDSIGSDAMKNSLLILGFFHPYCNAGGGGERVLWTAIHTIQENYSHIMCVVYTGDTDVSKEEILEKVKTRFSIELNPDSIAFVFLNNRNWVEDSRYPRFTLLGQSLGSIVLGFEALKKLTPDIYFDTMGYAFTYPLAKKIFGCRVAAYVHYPTISSDMLNKVQERRPGFNNDNLIAQSRVFSTGKIWYYKIFAYLYSLAGSFAEIVMVNSTWTKGHIDQLWGVNSTIVYPPCDTTSLSKLPLDGRQRVIVSVAQFRPEKDHLLQLHSLHRLLLNHPNFREGREKVELVLVGSSRNESDDIRVAKLREKCKELDIVDNVKFEINASFQVLVDWLSKAKVGIHTMWNEHFGIGVVEYMAAGIITVAHNSGGPKMDIVISHNGQRTGFLANDSETFASELSKAFSLSDAESRNIQINAREHAVIHFSEHVFQDAILKLFESIFGLNKSNS